MSINDTTNGADPDKDSAETENLQESLKTPPVEKGLVYTGAFRAAGIQKPMLANPSIKRIEAETLKVVNVSADKAPVLLFSTRTHAGYIEKALPCTQHAYSRLVSYNPIPDLARGLIGTPRYNFILYLEDKKVAGMDKPVTFIAGITSFPERNFADGDMEAFFRRPIPQNAAILNFYDYGDFDVLAFPLKSMGVQHRHLPEILRSIDKATAFHSGASISLGGYGTANVQNIVGNEVTLIVRNK